MKIQGVIAARNNAGQLTANLILGVPTGELDNRRIPAIQPELESKFPLQYRNLYVKFPATIANSVLSVIVAVSY